MRKRIVVVTIVAILLLVTLTLLFMMVLRENEHDDAAVSKEVILSFSKLSNGKYEYYNNAGGLSYTFSDEFRFKRFAGPPWSGLEIYIDNMYEDHVGIFSSSGKVGVEEYLNTSVTEFTSNQGVDGLLYVTPNKAENKKHFKLLLGDGFIAAYAICDLDSSEKEIQIIEMMKEIIVLHEAGQKFEPQYYSVIKYNFNLGSDD